MSPAPRASTQGWRSNLTAQESGPSAALLRTGWNTKRGPDVPQSVGGSREEKKAPYFLKNDLAWACRGGHPGRLVAEMGLCWPPGAHGSASLALPVTGHGALSVVMVVCPRDGSQIPERDSPGYETGKGLGDLRTRQREVGGIDTGRLQATEFPRAHVKAVFIRA